MTCVWIWGTWSQDCTNKKPWVEESIHQWWQILSSLGKKLYWSSREYDDRCLSVECHYKSEKSSSSGSGSYKLKAEFLINNSFSKKRPHASVGTHGYMAPEVLSKSTAYDSSADWFSFGCMLYKLLKGHSPFRQHKTKVWCLLIFLGCDIHRCIL